MSNYQFVDQFHDRSSVYASTLEHLPCSLINLGTLGRILFFCRQQREHKQQWEPKWDEHALLLSLQRHRIEGNTNYDHHN